MNVCGGHDNGVMIRECFIDDLVGLIAPSTKAGDALREAARQAQEVLRGEVDHLLDCCTLNGDRSTLDDGAKPDVERIEAAINALDAALSPEGGEHG